MSLDKYFTESSEQLPPRVRFWGSLKEHQGGDVVVELHQETDGLAAQPARLSLIFHDAQGAPQKFEEAIWEPIFERWLLDEQRISYANPEGDEIRAQLLLKEAFRPIVEDVGPTYFESVLARLLRKEPFSGEAQIQEMLEGVPEGVPSATRLRETEASIEAAIASVAQRLARLYARRDKAERVLVAGLARFLDERYSVSIRRRLGWG